MKVAVIGNCQAQAMQAWIATDAPSIEIILCGPSYMMGEADREQLLGVYEAADYIFQQRVADDYPVDYLRPSFMREHYRNKYVSWPNIYFDGYFPGIRYLYDLKGKVTGPISDYHFDFVLDGYKAGRPVEEIARIFQSEELLTLHPESISRSLRNLADREEGLDARISDYIARGLGGPQMFYAMNHPVDALLREMIERLIGFIGERRRLAQHTPFQYTLDEIELPAFPIIQERRGVAKGAFDGRIKGKALHEVDGRLVSRSDSVQYYDWTSLVDAYFQVYRTTENG